MNNPTLARIIRITGIMKAQIKLVPGFKKQLHEKEDNNLKVIFNLSLAYAPGYP